MIRKCSRNDLDEVFQVINDAAQAYQGIIPAECWKEPYMSMEELHHEIAAGVNLWGYEENGRLIGVMGMQLKADVTLIRHAYVRTANRNHGIGGKLLAHLLSLTSLPVLIGTWADADWAIHFYQKHGFELVKEGADQLLKKYWTASARHMEASVVLADRKWFELNQNVRGID